MKTQMKRSVAGFAAATVLTLSLAGLAGGASAQLPAGPGGVANGLPELTVSEGAIGNVYWVGSGVAILDNAGWVTKTQQGPKKNLCRFAPNIHYKAGNIGTLDVDVATVTKVYRGKTLVYTRNYPAGYFKVGTWTTADQWQIDLAEGMNHLRVVMDATKQIKESNENNSFGGRIMVNIDCDGDGYINGKPVDGAKPAGGGLKAAPGKPDPDPKPRKLKIQPRG